MRLFDLVLGLAVLGVSLVQAAPTYKPVRAPAYPLLVRSPYLNSWLQGESGGILPGSWPRFWTGQVLGWQGLVSVDGDTYTWVGAAPGFKNADQLSAEYTSTKSIFTFSAGKVDLVVTLLSPIYYDDLSKQSQQFSYVSVKAKSADDQHHDVQVYMDVSGEWASGNVTHVVRWDFDTTDGISYHKFYREQQAAFRENNEIAAWGAWYLSTASGNGVTHKSGFADDVRAQFSNKKALDNTVDPTFRAVQDRWPVFAFAKDLGSVAGDEQEVVFSLGLIQADVIAFSGKEGEQTPLPGLWSAFHANDQEAVAAFYEDYGEASKVSETLDQRIQRDSTAAGGEGYATITTLAVRQTFGALQFAGTSAQPYIFLKEISSNSDIQTVDVIFPSYPMLLYLNPAWTRYLLDPLFENQENGRYPNKYAIHDLGTFPVAKGHPDGKDEAMPLEECGNMIIMTLAYANRTGDVDYLTAHYKTLAQWAEFLIENALIPANQLSTDDFLGTLANQTNLAIKGIIGLEAMSRIAQLTGNDDEYGSIAKDYLGKWQGFAINKKANPPHTTLAYGNDSSHGLLYNIYADRMLGLNFIPQEIFDMQSDFYQTIFQDYGIPLDTRHPWVKADWEMFAAAVAKPDTRASFISDLAKWVGSTNTNRAMTDLFDAATGGYPVDGPTFVARPVMGACFAILALP